MQPYTEHFFSMMNAGARRSAEAIVPLVLELIRPRSVIDVGCGLGAWLSVFRKFGVEEVLGIDGDYVDREMLEIPPDRFITCDLNQPFRLEKKFDLVVSLEVAEHLAFESAERFVESLVSLGSVVLFSAAIPYQGGTDHINEQWQDYWANLFGERGYVAIDCIRSKVWQNPNVEWWYAQNTLVYVERDYLLAKEQGTMTRLLPALMGKIASRTGVNKSCSALLKEYDNTDVCRLRMVHPRRYLHAVGTGGRLYGLVEEIAQAVPPGETLILIDQDCQGREEIADRDCMPLLIGDGYDWHRPLDDDSAVQEVERARQDGARFIAFGKPVHWWLYYYSGLQRHLRGAHQAILENEQAVVFDLRT